MFLFRLILFLQSVTVKGHMNCPKETDTLGHLFRVK